MAEDILKDALDFFRQSADDSTEIRQAAEEDIRFARLGQQWPEEVIKQRNEEGRPLLTINRQPAFIRHVVNAARQGKPGIIVSPVDDGADKETADVISGLIRSIERVSGAELAYDTGLDNSVTCGIGFFRLGIDYAHEDSFEMRATIDRVPNPLQVHWDTRSTRFDASDWEYAFISDFIRETVFESRYGKKAKKISFSEDDRDAAVYWTQGDMVRVAEYWQRVEHEREIYLMSDGTVVRADRLPDIGKAMGADGTDKELTEFAMMSFESRGLTIVKTRKAKYYDVHRRIISGVEVLEEDEWPGSMIPVCPVWGEEVFEGGKRHFRSMVRDMRDPQKMFNYWRSASTELVALAPRAPWLVEQGAIPKGEEEKWRTANTRSHSYLTYTAGRQQPSRVPFAGVPAGVLQESLNAADDMKAITGIYDASLGARSNETSGVAINSRKRESENSNFHFIDNLSRAIKYAGQCLVEIIPSVYSERETIRILGEDMKEKVVNMRSEGKIYDLSVGKYDVTVKAGPSFETQREEAREGLIEIMREIPGSAALIGDVLLDHMDFPQSGLISQRMKQLLPPAVQEMENAGDGAQAHMSPEHQQVMAQMQQQAQAAQQQIEAMGQELAQAKAVVESSKAVVADKQSQSSIADRKMKLDENRFEFEKFRDQRDMIDRERQAATFPPPLPPDTVPALTAITQILQQLRDANIDLAESMSAPAIINRALD